jgi:hypothetical protein
VFTSNYDMKFFLITLNLEKNKPVIKFLSKVFGIHQYPSSLIISLYLKIFKWLKVFLIINLL